ncbi:MAG: hypothetical protein ACRD02_03415 [Acidimicrobiia bacterium]
MAARKVSRRKRRPQASHPSPEFRPAQTGWRKRLGWPLVVMGGILFLGGQVGARTGFVFLPFDTHHLLAQWGGALLVVTGLVWATRE